MKFEVYDLVGPTPKYLIEKKDAIVTHLIDSKTYSDDRSLRYCLNNIDTEANLIGGTLSQEYFGDFKTVDPKSKLEKPLDSNPWEKTFFFIDTVTGKILIHKRKYSPRNLEHGKSLKRIEDILREVFMEHHGTSLEIVKTIIGQNNEFFKDVLRTERVQILDVTNLLGKKIPVGTTLHNPREDWDEVWAESWNEYDSNYVEEVMVRAPNGGDLSKSVIHKAVLAAEGDIRSVTYYDTEDEKPRRISKKSVGAVHVDAKNEEEPVTIMKKAFDKIEKSRDLFRRFRRK
jgi:hypothetical protein